LEPASPIRTSSAEPPVTHSIPIRVSVIDVAYWHITSIPGLIGMAAIEG